MRLLILLHAGDVDVDTVAERVGRALVERLVALGRQLVAELEVRGDVLAARVRVQRVGHDVKPFFRRAAFGSK